MSSYNTLLWIACKRQDVTSTVPIEELLGRKIKDKAVKCSLDKNMDMKEWLDYCVGIDCGFGGFITDQHGFVIFTVAKRWPMCSKRGIHTNPQLICFSN
jgi:hypothetical protein